MHEFTFHKEPFSFSLITDKFRKLNILFDEKGVKLRNDRLPFYVVKEFLWSDGTKIEFTLEKDKKRIDLY